MKKRMKKNQKTLMKYFSYLITHLQNQKPFSKISFHMILTLRTLHRHYHHHHHQLLLNLLTLNLNLNPNPNPNQNKNPRELRWLLPAIMKRLLSTPTNPTQPFLQRWRWIMAIPRNKFKLNHWGKYPAKHPQVR